MKRKRGRSLEFWAVTICLIFVAAFCTAGTVRSQSSIGEQELENYYRDKERQLVKDIRDYLKEQGYRNSGVMLTRVIEQDGTRNYTVTVHHEKIDKMDGEARKNLQINLSGIVFQAENCSFYHEFLVTD